MVIMMMFHTVISNDINVTCYSSLQRQVDLLDGSPSLMIILSGWADRQTVKAIKPIKHFHSFKKAQP